MALKSQWLFLQLTIILDNASTLIISHRLLVFILLPLCAFTINQIKCWQRNSVHHLACFLHQEIVQNSHAALFPLQSQCSYHWTSCSPCSQELLAGLSFTMMQLWEWLQIIRKNQNFSIAHFRQNQYCDVANLCINCTPFINWGGND